MAGWLILWTQWRKRDSTDEESLQDSDDSNEDGYNGSELDGNDDDDNDNDIINSGSEYDSNDVILAFIDDKEDVESQSQHILEDP